MDYHSPKRVKPNMRKWINKEEGARKMSDMKKLYQHPIWDDEEVSSGGFWRMSLSQSRSGRCQKMCYMFVVFFLSHSFSLSDKFQKLSWQMKISWNAWLRKSLSTKKMSQTHSTSTGCASTLTALKYILRMALKWKRKRERKKTKFVVSSCS